MSGERDFCVRNKNPNLDSLLLLDGWIARKDERRLLQVGFACQILHLRVAQPARVWKHDERVTLQTMGGKDVDLHERVAAGVFRLIGGGEPRNGGDCSA